MRIGLVSRQPLVSMKRRTALSRASRATSRPPGASARGRCSRSATGMIGSLRAPSRQFARSSPRSCQTPTASPAAYAAPSAVVSITAGRTTGMPRRSAWNCMELRVLRHAAVDAELRERRRAVRDRVAVRRVDDVPGLEGRRLDGGAHDVRLRREAGEPDDRAARIRPPVGREEAGERRDEVDVAAVLDRGGEALGVGPVRDDAEVVAEPVEERAGDRDRALERVVRRTVAETVPDGRDEAGGGADDLLAGAHDEEAAGAVGHLRLARAERRLPEGRGLLVAEDARDGDAVEGALRDRAVDLGGGSGCPAGGRGARRTRRAARRPSRGSRGP